MASIHRRPASRYWHAAWRNAQGRLVLRSTKQTERAKALSFAIECERAEKLAGASSRTEVQARKIVQDIMERTGSDEPLRNPLIQDWLREWMLTKQTSTSDTTAIRYQQIVEEFITHLGDRAKRPLSALSPRDVDTFLAKRAKSGCGPSTIQVDGKILRAAFNKARRMGLISTNPAEAIDLPARESVERGTFTSAEVKLLVDTAEGEWKTLILLGYYTGARLGDCCVMEWSSVDFTGGLLTFKQRKSRKSIAVPIHPELAAHLEDLASTDTPQKFIMPGMADKDVGGRNGLSKGFLGIMHKAGLDPQSVQGSGSRLLSRRSFHALRHSFTSALANAGVPPELRMKLTGHSSEAVHRGYTHHELATLRDAVGKLPPLNGSPK